MYGLPKIHKESVPLRPIVSTIGFPTYRLAKELARILSPLVGHAESFIKNSSHFVKDLGQLSLEKNSRMMSFNVVSLFTRVPIDEALQVISTLTSRLWTEQASRQMSSANTWSFACAQPTSRLRMGYSSNWRGSPLSPIVANLFMESLERRALQTAEVRPRAWLRYVDDVFAVWNGSEQQFQQFREHMNHQHPVYNRGENRWEDHLS